MTSSTGTQAAARQKSPRWILSGSMALSEAHLSLLRKYLRVAPYLLLTDDPDLVASTIWYTDLCAGNLFVDKGHITSVIDWLGP
ncbi:hypothetical protein H106_03909 [Trichophyton rubrum CBS 735.88]|nr:hypothetical protein H106_03909 [Trichophyton rubrum CBS 735.88]